MVSQPSAPEGFRGSWAHWDVVSVQDGNRDYDPVGDFCPFYWAITFCPYALSTRLGKVNIDILLRSHTLTLCGNFIRVGTKC
jgi:hypothetical protein